MSFVIGFSKRVVRRLTFTNLQHSFGKFVRQERHCQGDIDWLLFLNDAWSMLTDQGARHLPLKSVWVVLVDDTITFEKGHLMKTRFIRNAGIRVRQRGQGMTEYIIITALIAIAAIAAVTYFGGTARAQIGGMAKELSGQSAKTDINRAKNQGNKAHSEGTKDKTLNSYDNDTAK
ncbi:Flp pilus assembly pilin Flp [Rhodanobacter sp. TND4EL1]